MREDRTDMAYDEKLGDRLREIVAESGDFTERKMFGGLAFMVKGHMCCGVIKEDMVVRVDPERSEQLLKDKSARPMDFSGKPMKGFLYIAPAGLRTEKQLRRWVDEGLSFVATLPPKSKKLK
ncbi:MAG TPA: TfoX/Sxy family protein [Actinomycetota bacterium]|nr:TfoX/Sxy family protein [Actinomycetota bacterium]